MFLRINLKPSQTLQRDEERGGGGEKGGLDGEADRADARGERLQILIEDGGEELVERLDGGRDGERSPDDWRDGAVERARDEAQVARLATAVRG